MYLYCRGYINCYGSDECDYIDNCGEIPELPKDEKLAYLAVVNTAKMMCVARTMNQWI